MHRNHRNSTISTPQIIGNSTKQVNKVKPNVTRNANETITSPGYANSRYDCHCHFIEFFYFLFIAKSVSIFFLTKTLRIDVIKEILS